LTVPIGKSCILPHGYHCEHHEGQIAQDGTPSFTLQAVSRTGTLVRSS
jgi:hypothetical protein